MHSLRTWLCYVEGSEFTVVTDHNPLVFFRTQQHLSRREACWNELLSAFTFDIQYKPGATNMADPLSRQPVGDAPVDEAVLMVTTRWSSSSVAARIKRAYAADPWFNEQSNLTGLTQRSGMWYKGALTVVPADKELRDMLLHEVHATKVAGHFGVHKTRAAVSRRYWWPTWHADAETSVKECDACQRNKTSTRMPARLLQPLPIPDVPWQSVSMDFIIQLPATQKGHDAILVFVDRLTKMVHFAPTRIDVSAKGVAQLFMEHVIRLHGYPKDVVFDRDIRFISRF